MCSYDVRQNAWPRRIAKLRLLPLDRASAVARASAAFKLNIPDLAARVISFSVFQLDLSNRWCAWLSKEERRDEETVVQAACRVGLALDNLVLPIHRSGRP